jgi:hypothetical protein
VTATTVNQRVVLAARPAGAARVDDFRLEEAPVPALDDGQVLVRNDWLSVDPYMRGRMDGGRSYAAPQPVGEVMLGGTAGEVVASRSARFAVGDPVVGMGGWQRYSVVTVGRDPLRAVDTRAIPLPAYLGPVGMPGVTAWYGLHRILAPRAGETVLVSAAGGAVGSVAGQLARRLGCRVVGIAGGADKCRHVVEELGFDACVDRRAHPDLRALAAALRDACPAGIDAVFENAGGPGLDAALLRCNPFARIALCGMIAGYDGEPAPLTLPQLLLVHRVRLQGFIVTEHLDAWPEALAELGGLVAAGELRYRETVAEGLAAAPAALLGLLTGSNLGKQLVRLG